MNAAPSTRVGWLGNVSAGNELEFEVVDDEEARDTVTD